MLFLLVACAPTVSAPPAPVEPAPPPVPPEKVYEAAAAFNATRPLYERPLGDGREGVEGLPDLSAQTCRGCHQEIHDEWTTSVHAVAWIDPQYQEEIKKSGNRWLCLNCHAPLQIQQDKLAIGLEDGDVERPILVDNPDFDPALRDEGITCAACHVRDGVIHGPGRTVAEGEAGIEAPHPVKADPETYSTGKLCERCHQATATYPGKNFICVFDTGEEWRAGPYDDEGTSCVTCHMPPEERPAAVGAAPRQVSRHWWRGAGIPKIAGRYPPPEANHFGLELAGRVEDHTVVVEATNAHAGHLLPTGDPERKVIVDLVFQSATGDISTEQWVFGQEWTWSPPTKHGDTRIAPRETRSFRVPIPDGAERAVLTATNQRMSEENRAYHHLDGYPIRVGIARVELELPAR